MKQLLSMLICILIIGVLGGSVSAAGGQKMASFELRALDGTAYTDRQLIGQPALLMFWASWCHVCQDELPKMQALYDRLKRTPFHILTVGFADTGANIRNYVESQAPPFTFPVIYDVGDRLASQLGVRSTPTFFLLNKQGAIVVVHRGGGLLDDPQFQTAVNHLLQEK
jgi:thiol-disulfide isomerase/thioredoxin